MPEHDPIPNGKTERTAKAWAQYKRLMSWMAGAAVIAVILAIIYLKSSGVPFPIHMMIATIAGVGFTVLLGTGLMGLVYFSSHSGHDDAASKTHHDEQH